MAFFQLLMCIWCLTALSQAQLQLTFVENPIDQTVVVGSAVNFSCEINVLNNGNIIAWYFGDDNQISSGTMIVGTEPRNSRVEVSGNRFTLILNGAQIIDSRPYRCAVVGSTGSVLLQSQSANLVVQFLPLGTDPVCSGGGSFMEGEPTSIGCDSATGNPIVLLGWTRSDGEDINHSRDVNFAINAAGRTEITYTFNIDRNDLNVTFTCTSTSPVAFPDYRASCDITFNVLYLPEEPTIQHEPPGPPDQGEVTCDSRGNPSPEIRWSVQGDVNYTVSIQGTTLMWNTSQSCSIVVSAECLVNNSVGVVIKSMVLCQPRKEGTTTMKSTTEMGITRTSLTTGLTRDSGDEASGGDRTILVIILTVLCGVLVIGLLLFVIFVVIYRKHRKEDKSRTSRGEAGEDNEGYTTRVTASTTDTLPETERYEYMKSNVTLGEPDDEDDYEGVSDAVTGPTTQAGEEAQLKEDYALPDIIQQKETKFASIVKQDDVDRANLQEIEPNTYVG